MAVGAEERIPPNLVNIQPDETSEATDEIRVLRGQTVCLFILTVLAICWALVVARQFLQPVVVAVLLALALSPISKALQRLRIPRIIAAAVPLVVILGLLGFAMIAVAEPAAQWRKDLPERIRQIESRFRGLRETVAEVAKTAERVENATFGQPPQGAAAAQSPARSFTASLLAQGPELLSSIAVTLLLLFYLLAYGEPLVAQFAEFIGRFTGFEETNQVAAKIYQSVGSYLLTVCAINFGLAIVLSVVVYAMGIPNAIFWGLLGGILNFIPYLGILVATTLFALNAVFSMETILQAVLATSVYYIFSAVIEGAFVTPSILGKKFTVNPIVILVWLLFWTWLWGVCGGLIACPLLFSLKLIMEELYFDPNKLRKVLFLRSPTHS